MAEAWRYHQAGHIQVAEQRYRQVLQVASNYPDAWYLLGVACHVQGRIDEAVACYEHALRLRADHVEVHSNLGVAYKDQGRTAEAIAHYREALRLRPTFADAYSNLGLALADEGRLDEAIANFREALRLHPGFPEAHLNLGKALQQQGERLEEAAACYRRALELRPDYAEAYNNLGGVLNSQEKLEEAADCFQRALRLRPDFPEANYNLGKLRHQQGRLDEAITCYRQAVLHRRDYAEVFNNLGVALGSQGRHDEALDCFQEAVRLRPDSPELHYNLGDILRQHERVDEAAACYRRALQLRSDYASAHVNLGVILNSQGKLLEATACFQQAILSDPGLADAYSNLGQVLDAQNKSDEALACYHCALELQPDHAGALNSLGVSLTSQGKLDEAEACLRQALAANPDLADVHNNLGNIFNDQGRLDEATECYRRALECRPDFAGAHSNLLVCLNYNPAIDPDALFAEHRRWAERHARDAAATAYPNTRDPDRPLRVGYFSPDFRRHAVAYFVEPIIAHHDTRNVQVYCYAEVAAPDEVSARFRSVAHAWRPTFGLSDARVVEQVRADGIDILVDLAGHTAHGRLQIFAHKAAPLQVAYVGYPNTTGLTTVDYRLTDAIADPPGEPVRHTEELVRMPYAFCYAPPAFAPAVSPLPALASGRVTFGSLHNLAKLNGKILDLWCALLRALPQARLLLHRHPLRGGARDYFHKQLTSRGLSPDRFELHTAEGRGAHLGHYAAIDIALDAFPWSGHTTACEALWMGVPVVTLYGDRYAGRMAASVLNNLAMRDWIAQTPEQFIDIACHRAGDMAALAELRATLRARMQAAPLCDGASFTRGLEETYRTLWRRWCADPQANRSREV
jgi:predicted O-linked N-acetylglucosamine transferase (SPINDLY family)